MHLATELKIHETRMDRIKGRNSSTIIVGHFNTPFSIMDRTNHMEDEQQTAAKEHHYKPVRLNKQTHDQFGVITRMQGWFNIQKHKTDTPLYVYTSCIAGGNPLVCLTIPLNLHSYRSAYSVLTTQANGLLLISNLYLSYIRFKYRRMA